MGGSGKPFASVLSSCWAAASSKPPMRHRPGVWMRFYVQMRLVPLPGASLTGWSRVWALPRPQASSQTSASSFPLLGSLSLSLPAPAVHWVGGLKNTSQADVMGGMKPLRSPVVVDDHREHCLGTGTRGRSKRSGTVQGRMGCRNRSSIYAAQSAVCSFMNPVETRSLAPGTQRNAPPTSQSTRVWVFMVH